MRSRLEPHRRRLGLALGVVGLLLLLVGAFLARGPSAPTRWAADFDRSSSWREGLGIVHERDEPVTGAAITDEAPGRPGGALRIRFGEDGSRWGIDVRSSLEQVGLEDLDEVYLSYDVHFPEGFEFVGDGKMGGLAGTSDELEAHEAASGGELADGSFSVRAVWKRDRGVAMYLYAHHAAGRDFDDPRHGGYGIQERFTTADGREGGVLRPGTWHHVQHRVKLNTPGQDDGLYELWIDGHRGVSLDDVRYRDEDHPDLTVDQLMMGFFFGGGEDEYPTRVNELYTDDWVLSTTPATS